MFSVGSVIDNLVDAAVLLTLVYNFPSIRKFLHHCKQTVLMVLLRDKFAGFFLDSIDMYKFGLVIFLLLSKEEIVGNTPTRFCTF